MDHLLFREAVRRMALPVFLCAGLLSSGCGGTARSPERLLISVELPKAVAVKQLDESTLKVFDGLDAEKKQQVLRVFVADAPEGAPSISGTVTRRGSELVFIPRYPFQPGMKYRAQFNPTLLAGTGNQIVSQFSIPAPPPRAVTRIMAIYPSSDQLPENLLRFYLHFSGPMSLGEAYQHVRLIDDKGAVVATPFLELDEELWNPQMTRFTLLFDPGRIKHGLVSQMELGPALVAGCTYKLEVDAGWRDAQGRPLVEPSTKTFTTTSAQREKPDPGRWQLTPPPHDSTQPLVVLFDRPMDYAMLLRVISVRDLKNQSVPGSIRISDHEQKWSFTPQSPWRTGDYHLTVETILEDPAGNSIRKEFEVDMTRPATPEAPVSINIPFQVP
jgi:hypothetical protein